MGNIKQIDIKNQSCYFFSDLINIKKFDLSLVKIDELEELQKEVLQH